jgi:uncharacterized protein
VIVPDVNLLVYAYNSASPWHEQAKAWWESALNGSETVGLAAAVALGFVRLMSNPRVVLRPVAPVLLLDIVQEWLDTGRVRLLSPGLRHFRTMRDYFEKAASGHSMTTDIHLAALAREQGARLYSNDSDFRRLEGIELVDPLQ